VVSGQPSKLRLDQKSTSVTGTTPVQVLTVILTKVQRHVHFKQYIIDHAAVM